MNCFGLIAILAIGLATGSRAAPSPAPSPSTNVEDARKHYIGHSVAGCEVIDFGCPTGWTGFEDAHGCGCISPPAPMAKAAAKTPCPRSTAKPR